MAKRADPQTSELISIAQVSRETGIGIETLRAWERRYGRPRPTRLPSGHRRYAPAEVLWLRRVAEALARGWRPGDVVTRSDRELEALARETCAVEGDRRLERLVELARELDEAALLSALRADARRLDAGAFLSRRVAPLLHAVGDAWRSGALDVRHEHVLSRVVERVLRSVREEARPRGGRAAPSVVLATLSGERHCLGLDMAAALLAAHGARTHVLGADTPNGEIVAAAKELGARAVAVSVSLATCGVESDRLLAGLRGALPDDVLVVVGGRGSRRLRRGVRGVEYFPDELGDFEAWLASGALTSGGA